MVFRRCEEHDRAAPTETVMPLIFPEGKFGPIVNMSMREQPDTIMERLALRLEILGKEHPLYPLAKELRARVVASRKAIKVYEAMESQVKTGQTEEKIARGTLRLQYENNYLDARKQLGKMRAERLLPKLSTSNRSVPSAEVSESSEESA